MIFVIIIAVTIASRRVCPRGAVLLLIAFRLPRASSIVVVLVALVLLVRLVRGATAVAPSVVIRVRATCLEVSAGLLSNLSCRHTTMIVVVSTTLTLRSLLSSTSLVAASSNLIPLIPCSIDDLHTVSHRSRLS